MPLTDDDAKEIIKTLALRKDNAYIIFAGFIAALLTSFLVILTIPSLFEPKTQFMPGETSILSLLYLLALLIVLDIGFLRFYKKYVAIKHKLNELKQPHLKEFYVGIFPEEQKISTVRVRQAGVLLRLWQIFVGVFIIIVGGYIVWKGYVLLNNFYSSLPSSMTGLNIIIVPLETTILYIVGLLLVILGLFMVFGKDKLLNWAQKIKIA